MAMVTITKTAELTDNEQWFLDNQGKYSLAIRFTNGIYEGGKIVSLYGSSMFNGFNGCAYPELEFCIAHLREYIEGDYQ